MQRCLAALAQLGLISRGDQQRVAITIAREDRRPTCYNLTMRRATHRRPAPTHGATNVHPTG
ncbi:hypothetical protein [Rhodococcus sp. 11-3]|uniref:hypothetical protein n=1 Tax=Rhodococcus sp. 11-3 TaxID=2854796 RepID=UPI00203D15E1|nr:hypothetical protein [Rhodococcus sp. 11-3]USC13002.1 hypothetical protein KZJ41_14670 [Rhodococcus sp. 11-3]